MSFAGIRMFLNILWMICWKFEKNFGGRCTKRFLWSLAKRSLTAKKPLLIRIFILVGVIRGQGIPAVYNTLKKAFKKDEIDYPDLDFWYYRFSSGDYDLDYDRSRDPKPLVFLDLNLEAAYLIFKELQPQDRIPVRRVSKNICVLIDSMRTFIDNVWLIVSLLNETETRFHWVSVKHVHDGPESARNDIKKAFDYLSFHLNLPGYGIEDFMLSFPLGVKCEDIFEEFINSLRQPLHVRKLRFKLCTLTEIYLLLLNVKPIILKEIQISYQEGENDMEIFDKIKLLEQWKLANELILPGHLIGPVEHYCYFKKITIELRVLRLEDRHPIRQLLYESRKIEHLRIIFHRRFTYKELQELFDAEEHGSRQMFIRIPATQEHYLITFLHSLLKTDINIIRVKGWEPMRAHRGQRLP
ncbi:hypothetical protein CRE_21252 [Caenorhabditis remanei]|uniref:F-box domain-containing protein n=1 Tax=Caenorhabditis remanei TaxID=31234 RepID=E3MF44_CAERE|nr:hypothetical protein CRE_21252 [Caenorhabditis remanei]